MPGHVMEGCGRWPHSMWPVTRQHVAYDPEKRKEYIFEAQEILAREVPEIPIFYTIRYNCFNKDKYDGWMFMYDHHNMTHGKLSYLDWK